MARDPGRVPAAARGARNALGVLRDTLRLWLAQNAFQHAGALAFYTLFSMAPLLIVLVAVAGAALGPDAARGEIAGRIEDLVGPRAAQAVQEAVLRSRPEQAGFLPGLLGLGALLFGSTTVFAQLQTSINQFWDVAAKPTRSSLLVFLSQRLASFGLVLSIGFLLLVSLVISAAVAAVVRFAEDWMPVPAPVVSAFDLGASLFVVTLLFAAIFKMLPDVRLEWRDMWVGAAIAAGLFVGGQYAIALYLTHTAPDSTYGAAGSLVVVLFWVYYSSLVLLFGVALIRTIVRRRGDWLVPKPTAVKIRTMVVEDTPAPPV